MVKRARPQKGEHIIDLGCGSGIVARQGLKYLNKSCQVTGADVITAVLEKTREICSPETEPVTWQQCDAMFQTILASISEYIDDHGLTAPLESYVVSAVKQG